MSTETAVSDSSSKGKVPPVQVEGQQLYIDCLSCRVTGTAVSLFISAYLLAQTYAQPAVYSPMHHRVMLAAAGGFAALGVVRALV